MSKAFDLRGITKSFGSVVANRGVDLHVRAGSIHGLIGENGAGKSTLMGILAGLHQPDEGSILVGGVPVTVETPRKAFSLGIGMVHQHFQLFPTMTVAENVVLGTRASSGVLHMRKLEANVGALSVRHRLELDPTARVRDLPVGMRQRVEILKVLHGGAEILIFDEPTAVLTPQESVELFEVFGSLRDDGKTIVFISHKLREILAVTEAITVMRRGEVVGELESRNASEEGLAELMIGRKVRLRLDPSAPHEGHDPELVDVALGETVVINPRLAQTESVSIMMFENVSVKNALGLPAIEDATFALRAGEILGIAGVAGNGQLELEECAAGLRPLTSGRIYFGTRDISRATTRERRELGLSYIPEDRFTRGSDRESTVANNLIMGAHYRRPLSRHGVMRRRAVARHSDELIADFGVAVWSRNSRMSALSGGNAQKVVVAREIRGTPSILLNGIPRVVIASQPTRGLDVGAIEYIHGRLLALRDQGAAILLISFDLAEVLSLSDRVRVLFEGTLSQDLLPSVVSEQEIGMLMGGAT